MQLWAANLPIPKTVYVPCDPYDTMKNGQKIANEADIADLLEQQLGQDVVVKPDAGTHGKGIVLSKDHKTLLANIAENTPSIINPVGVVAQEVVAKWFYDLRIIVSKSKGSEPVCYPIAMARAGFNDFRTILSWKLGVLRQTASAYSGLGREMWQSLRQRQPCLHLRYGRHDKCGSKQKRRRRRTKNRTG
jgi:hypothetical protein